MHGKSGAFASQNLRFRNAKAQLSLFNKIIFTKSTVFWGVFLEHKREKQLTQNIKRFSKYGGN
ncbi:hypothetical protein CTI16_00750 [Prevotella intermedia]|uniref:Uncharacterized protein n=1 Tax=Prevotella intermedia TaxID=28131 RepID=A0A2G8I2I6_PREIN|nr:hypothetical protein [Prevotella intermedia]ATV37836.1 hypothetical protein CUB95_04340 [Prevotella intermedia]PIK17733.1 hypothetical protein CTI16_00750 [Prevotella intermedia]PJI28183.1 hypothetical protein CTM58_08935 [Prevotella intermedia]